MVSGNRPSRFSGGSSSGASKSFLSVTTSVRMQELHAGGNSDSRQEGRLDFGGIEQFYTAVEEEECKLDIRCGLHEMVTVTQTVAF